MRYIIVDLEATCWAGKYDRARMEMIEIGAVEMLRADAEPARSFVQFVRPIAEPQLSDYCTELTSITQADVDSGVYFYDALPRFLDWIGPEPYTLCSWGMYDKHQFERDCLRHGLPFPDAFNQHLNLKAMFARWKNTPPPGMKTAFEVLGWTMEGRHHRGIDDARNIARIAREMLPLHEQSPL